MEPPDAFSIRPGGVYETRGDSYRHFIDGAPTAGLFSDEAVSFFGGHGMSEESRGRTIAMLSKLWDGSSLSRTRGSGNDSGTLIDRRLSAHLMMQPIVADKVLGDPLLMGQGFLARFLISNEISLAGTRLLKGKNLNSGPHTDNAIKAYWEVLNGLLRKPLNLNADTGGLCLHQAKIEGTAFVQWCSLHDCIEEKLGPGGCFSAIKPFASKAAENAARIAAILALVEGYDKPTVVHINRSWRLINYYLNELASQVNGAARSDMEAKAFDLYNWMKERGNDLHSGDFKYLPKQYRNAKMVRSLLEVLVSLGRIEVTSHNHQGKPNGWRCVLFS